MTTSTSTAAPTATPVSFSADDFATNFVTDLAPLLALFGDQATKQFLSLSTGWADNIMVSMGPLGILTIVVSAIRVSRLKWLKALIGRARESFAAAEVEVLSSTSEDVCERYNGNEIIRKEGKTETKEFIFRSWKERDSSSRAYFGISETRPILMNWVFDLREACVAKVIQPTSQLSKRKWQWKDLFRNRGNKTTSEAEGNQEGGLAYHVDNQQEIGPGVFELLEKTAPNITLHVPEAIVPSWELWLFALFGILIQSAVLVLSGITIYRWHFQKSGAIVGVYAYPCFLAGTISLNAGLLICARTIQGSTENANFVLTKPPSGGVDAVDRWMKKMLHQGPYMIVRIQRFAEKEPDSWAIFNSASDKVLRTSRSHGPRYKLVTALGSVLAVIGYLAQYLGSRGLPWSTTIMQLVATVTMAAVRAIVRRGLANEPFAVKIGLKDHELSWLARKICESGPLEPVSGSLRKRSYTDIPSSAALLPMQLKDILNASKIVHRNLDYQTFAFPSKPILKGLIETHIRLQQLSTWTYPYENLVDNLVSAMTAVLTTFNRDYKLKGQKKIQEVKFDLPNVLFCKRGQDNYEPEVATLQVTARLADLESGGAFIKSKLGAILDFWTEGDKPDNKVSGRRATKYNNYRARTDILSSFEEVGPQNLRIIGSVIPQSRWSERRLHILQNFIPQEGVYLIPPSDGSHEYDLKLSAKGLLTGYSNTSGVTSGLLFSSLSRSRLLWAENKTDAQPSEAARTVVFPNHNRIEHPDLAVYSSNSIEVDCVYDIFSAFMLGMARNIINLGGEYEHRSKPWTMAHGRTESSRQLWSNSIIDQLASAVTASGLVGDIEEAYVLIVPALASEDLLPEVTSLEEFEMFYWPTYWAERGPYGKRLYNGFSLSACESQIRTWFREAFTTQNVEKDTENFEKVVDFIFKPEDRLSTQNEETTTICNRTRAAMYLLRDYAAKEGKTVQNLKLKERLFQEAMQDLEKAHKRMVPTSPLPGEEEVKQLYPNLILDIKRIVEGDERNRPPNRVDLRFSFESLWGETFGSS